MSRPKILHISLTNLQYDARVKRAMECGFKNGFDTEILAPDSGISMLPMTRARKIQLGAGFGLSRLFGTRLLNIVYDRFYPQQEIVTKGVSKSPDLIHAHDWDTLPVATKIGKQLNIPVIYDTHEYAFGMHFERPFWRYLMSPAIGALERQYIQNADHIITVSRGIARQLQMDYGLQILPDVVRNLPKLEKVAPDPIEQDGQARTFLLHYHGILAKGRGIELLVETLSRLPQNFRLQLVGPERQRGFVDAIRSRAATLNLGARLEVLPAVPSDELIKLAATADIGFCILENSNPHYRFALPNKVFEYMMGGLFVVVSDSQEMAELVSTYEAGLVAANPTPDLLAQQIMAVSPQMLQETRKRNISSAKILCWEREQEKLAAIYKTLLERGKKAG